MDQKQLLAAGQTILLIDWPSPEVPELLARAGLHVVVRGGPGPTDYSAYEYKDGAVARRHLGRPPERADLVYTYRPLSELPGIVTQAANLHAKAIWAQSNASEEELGAARQLVEAAGLQFVTEPLISDVARQMLASRSNA